MAILFCAICLSIFLPFFPVIVSKWKNQAIIRLNDCKKAQPKYYEIYTPFLRSLPQKGERNNYII